MNKLKGKSGLSYGKAYLMLASAFLSSLGTVQAGTNVNREVGVAENHSVMQQLITVKGKILGTDGEPIIGANVMVKGTTNGVISDLDGNFMLRCERKSVLVISYIGYKSAEKVVENSNPLNIVLEVDSKTLDEVVVVGFGKQRKVNLTGSVSVIDNKALAERPARDAVDMLQGTTPGLNISRSSGNLEQTASINIRGVATLGEGSNGSPLILIDGVEGSLSGLNPQDIDNISVLKDAAAASIYGSRAPFGIVLVTTKKGVAGKVKVNYNNNFRFNSPNMWPNVVDSETFAKVVNDNSINSGEAPFFSDEWMDRIIRYKNGEKVPMLVQDNGQWVNGYNGGHANSNWFREVFKSNSFSEDHNVSMSGGGKDLQFYVSAALSNQEGLVKMKTDKYKRYNLMGRINATLTPFLDFEFTSRFTREKNTRPSYLDNGLWGNILRQGWPIMPVYDDNGYLYDNGASPILRLRDGGKSSKYTDKNQYQGKFTFKLLKNWNFIADMTYRTQTTFSQSYYLPTFNHDKNGNPYYSSTKTSRVWEYSFKSDYYNMSAYSNFDFSLDKHKFHFMAGAQIENHDQRDMNMSRDGLISYDVHAIDATTGIAVDGTEVDPYLSGAYDDWAVLGFFGRFNYNYQDRYLLEANLRYDGSSRFRANNRWILLPSFSLGWNIAQEAFWNVDVVDQLKLRASYGSLGNQNTKVWYPTYVSQPNTTNGGGWLVDGKKPNVSSAPALVSKNLSWERVVSYNLGLDYALFNNRLSGSFDYYIRNTTEMVGPAPQLPNILGTGVPKQNNTDLRTYGWEFSVSWKDKLFNDELGYGISAWVADSQTKVTKYPNKNGLLSTYREGQKLGEIWGYETIGIAKTKEEMDAHLATLTNGGQFGITNNDAGDMMYRDLNGDKKISEGENTESNPGDRRIIGNTTPRYRVGLNLDLNYKGFDFRMMFEGVMKRDYYTDSQVFYPGGWIWGVQVFKEHLDYYRTDKSPLGENLNAYYARPIADSRNRHTQTRYVLDASYLRCKNLTLGYTLPRSWVAKTKVLSNVRFYVAGENLFTITGLTKLFDPETINTTSENRYPLFKTVSLGLSVSL